MKAGITPGWLEVGASVEVGRGVLLMVGIGVAAVLVMVGKGVAAAVGNIWVNVGAGVGISVEVSVDLIFVW
jgi:hypothetical protein